MTGKDSRNPPESDPSAWKNVKLLKQGEDKKDLNQHNEEKESQVPLPIIWMPGHNKPEEVEKKELKEINASPKKDVEELPPKLKIIPVKVLENNVPGEKLNKPVVSEEISGSGINSAELRENSKIKNVPPKHVEESREKSMNKPSSSPVKASKLPPVCLRVDPLPRKTRNGTSRSPSPPKEKIQQYSKAKEPALPEAKEGNSKTKEIKVVQIKETPIMQSDKGEDNRVQEIQQDSREKDPPLLEAKEENLKTKDSRAVQIEATPKIRSVKREDYRVQDQAQILIEAPAVSNEEVERAEIGGRQHQTEQIKGEEVAKESEKGEELKEKRKELSSTDAAVVIQSAYRGFVVRRWQPLKKLKDIVRVREQVDDVRKRICNLEASAEQQQDEKQRMVINETIMSLLLQLDAIQGLHPSVREIRKSVARDLVCLQEKLDSLATKATVEKHKLTSTEGSSAEDLSKVANGVSSLMRTEPTSNLEEPEVDSVMERNVVSDSILEEHENTKQREFSELSFVEADESVTRVEDQTSVPEHENISAMALVEDKQLDSEVVTSVKNDEPDCSDSEGIPLVELQSVNAEPDPDSVSNESARACQLVEEKIPCSEIGVLTDSRTVGEETSAKLKESVKPLQVANNEKPILEAEILVGSPLASEEESAEHSLKEGNAEIMDRFTQLMENDECNLEVEKPAELPLGANDQDPAFNAEESLKLLSAKDGGELESELSSLQNIQADSTPQEILMLPLVEGEFSDEIMEVSEKNESIYVSDSIVDNSNSQSPMPADPTQENNDEKIKEDDINLPVEEIVALKAEAPVFEGKDNATCQCLGSELCENELLEPSLEEKEVTSATSKAEIGNDTCQIEETAKQLSGSEFPREGTVVEVETLPGTKGPNPESAEQATEQKTASEDSIYDAVDQVAGIAKGDEKLVEENEKLREMLEKLMEAGKQQVMVISDLNGRVRDLGRRLTRKKKPRVKRQHVVGGSCSSSIKTVGSVA